MDTPETLLDLYTYVTTSGIIVPNTETVKVIIENTFKDIFGSDLDVSEETPVGRLIEALSILFRTTLGVNAQNANQFNINTATGVYLDSLAQVYGMSRVQKSHTYAEITVTTTSAGVTIPAGSIIENTETKSSFKTVNTIIVPPN